MRQCQEPNYGAARLLLAVADEQRLERAPVSAAREQLVTIDQIEQGHRFALQGMDDVPVIDDVAVFAAGLRAPPAQAHQRRRAEKAFQPIVVKPYPQVMADQP